MPNFPHQSQAKSPPVDPEVVWRQVIRARLAWCNMLLGARPSIDVLVIENPHYCPEPERFGPPDLRARAR